MICWIGPQLVLWLLLDAFSTAYSILYRLVWSSIVFHVCFIAFLSSCNHSSVLVQKFLQDVPSWIRVEVWWVWCRFPITAILTPNPAFHKRTRIESTQSYKHVHRSTKCLSARRQRLLICPLYDAALASAAEPCYCDVSTGQHNQVKARSDCQLRLQSVSPATLTGHDAICHRALIS